MKLTTLALLVALGIGAVSLVAQTPDLSGTWKLNRGASQISPGAGLAQLDRGGVPNSLYVTQAANGTLTIGSDHNGMMARAYMVGGESSIPAAPTGTIKVKTRWDGRVLLVEGANPDAPGTALKETFSMSADGQTLTVTVTSTTAAGATTTTLVYNKTLAESDCKSWPTPCREPNITGRGR
jgi:hypothetical protein